MKQLFAILIILTSLFTTNSQAKEKREKEKYDIYLLIGQSNMAGRGTMIESDTINDIEGVFILNKDGEIVPARNPLNQYSTIGKSYNMQQIGPGLGFSSKIYNKTGRKILLVVNARGGSNISEWHPCNETTKFYSEAVRRANQAKKYGEIKAILWHQGCSDLNDENRGKYMDRLSNLVLNLRKDLKDKKLYFVAGELAYWIENSPSFNKALHSIADIIPNSDYISVDGANMLKDESDPHFGRSGQIIIGERYGDKVLNKIYNIK